MAHHAAFYTVHGCSMLKEAFESEHSEAAIGKRPKISATVGAVKKFHSGPATIGQQSNKHNST